jgi:hypothetical protein
MLSIKPAFCLSSSSSTNTRKRRALRGAVGDRMEWGVVVVKGESRAAVAKEAAE